MMKLLSYVPGKSLGWVETVRNIVSGVLEKKLLKWPFLEIMKFVTKIKTFQFGWISCFYGNGVWIESAL